MASLPTKSSPEGGRPAAPTSSNIASSQSSQSSDPEVKYQSGLMPADFGGLEVASSPGMRHYQNRGQYQPAPSAHGLGPGGYAPYQDQHTGAPYDNTQYPHSAVATAYDSQAGGAPKGEKRIWGIRAATFWVAIVALVFFLGTIGASAAAGTIAQAHAAFVQTCQATYTVPNSSVRFVRECGNNYPMNDLGKIPLTRIDDCMNLCAALAVTTQSADGPCVGVAWVTAGKQGTDENYCWLKGAQGSPDPKANVEAAWIVK
ncbi:hypothetical protein Ct61P_14906 [Colletotrichum tofieldiae]|nr:hypothetical protein Ct61P_14906 [Colletotrichum tofieldiae]